MAVDPSPERFRDLMHETLDEWASFVHEHIDEFGDRGVIRTVTESISE